ncbi:MAG: sialidase family protein [Terracidiphilus sp.]
MREMGATRLWLWLVLLVVAPLELWCTPRKVEETELLISGHDAINTYRIPSIISTRNGTVLVFCEGRRDRQEDGSPTDIVLKRSLSNHGPSKMKWQPIQILLTTRAGEAYMNPVPIVDERDGTIFLLVNPYTQPYKDVPVHIWLMKSRDEGATWSSPTDITMGTGLKELGPGIGIQMRNGRLVAPVYDGVIFSDDHGKTWKSGGKIPDVYSESQVVELVDGSLLLNVRQGGHRAIGISRDGGQTWSKPENDMALSDPTDYRGCQASLIRYSRKEGGKSKNFLLFSNPSDPNHRLNMTVRISYDEGRTWPVAKRIKEGPGGYSSMTVLPDGSIGMVYESGSFRTISFVRFKLEWITGGQESSLDHETRTGN